MADLERILNDPRVKRLGRALNGDLGFLLEDSIRNQTLRRAMRDGRFSIKTELPGINGRFFIGLRYKF